jgi:hypothetical protein
MEDNEYKRQSKDRLERIICKKVTTTMIGALHAFEEQFAHMWENDIEMKDKWAEARGKVLDIGNKQIKDLKEEFKQYTMNWDRYQYEIKFLPAEGK